MNQKYVPVFALLFALLLSAGAGAQTQNVCDATPADGSPFGDWPLKVPLTFTLGDGETEPGYQAKVLIDSGSVPSGWDWGNECADGKTSRIRFYDPSAGAELRFFVESCSAETQEMTAWVGMAAPITTGYHTIYMYYGNYGAEPLSDVTVMNFFDDFEDGDVSDWVAAGYDETHAEGVTVYQGDYSLGHHHYGSGDGQVRSQKFSKVSPEYFEWHTYIPETPAPYMYTYLYICADNAPLENATDWTQHCGNMQGHPPAGPPYYGYDWLMMGLMFDSSDGRLYYNTEGVGWQATL